MKITVTCPDTIFGVISKTFGDYIEAMKWIEVCLLNDLKVEVVKART